MIGVQRARCDPTSRKRALSLAREAIVRVVKPYELHGVRYYQLTVSYGDDPDSVREIRISHDSIYDDPSAGDRIEVDMILNIVTEVRKKA